MRHMALDPTPHGAWVALTSMARLHTPTLIEREDQPGDRHRAEAASPAVDVP